MVHMVKKLNGSTKCQIIINADDMGLSETVNAAIDKGFNAGWLTSATILAGAPAFEQAVQIARKYPQFSFGVHLDLMDYGPLSISKAGMKYCKSDGSWNRSFEKNSSLKDTKFIIEECMAQIDFIRSNGINISHIDSHYHIHTLPNVFIALKRIQVLSQIFKVRTTRNLIPKKEKQSTQEKLKIIKKWLWHHGLRNLAFKTITTDYFGSVSDFINVSKEVNACHWEGKTIELMCHPGLENTEYAHDCKLLSDGVFIQVGMLHELISYHHL
jgi:chitin disaccharide deacetylase